MYRRRGRPSRFEKNEDQIVLIQRWWKKMMRIKLPILRLGSRKEQVAASIVIQRWWRNVNAYGQKVMRMRRRLLSVWNVKLNVQERNKYHAKQALRSFILSRQIISRRAGYLLEYIRTKANGQVSVQMEKTAKLLPCIKVLPFRHFLSVPNALTTLYAVTLRITSLLEYEIVLFDHAFVMEKGIIQSLEHLNMVMMRILDPDLRVCRGIDGETAPRAIQFSQEFTFQNGLLRSFRATQCQGLFKAKDRWTCCPVCAHAFNRAVALQQDVGNGRFMEWMNQQNVNQMNQQNVNQMNQQSVNQQRVAQQSVNSEKQQSVVDSGNFSDFFGTPSTAGSVRLSELAFFAEATSS